MGPSVPCESIGVARNPGQIVLEHLFGIEGQQFAADYRRLFGELPSTTLTTA